MSESGIPLTDRRWLLDAVSVGAGRSGQISASAAERAAVATALELQDCGSLVFSYDLKPLSRRRFQLHAAIAADVVQSCVVTLEPVPARIDETSDSELVPEGQAPETPPDEALDVLNAPVIETYADGGIDLGRIAFELLSVSLDPYPRKPGAQLPADVAAATAIPSPFAALARLRKD